MKKILVTCLMAFIMAINFSFTANPESCKKEIVQNKCFKRYHIIVGQTYPISGTNCTISVAIGISFNWDGPGHEISGVTQSPAQFSVNCGGGVYARASQITNLDWDDQDAHCTDIAFAETGDAKIDKMLTDPVFLKHLKDEMNYQVDFQKP